MRIHVMVVCVSAVAVWMANADASAQLITPISQSRSVSAGVDGSPTNTQSATNFGPFIASEFASGQLSDVTGSQNSQINPFSILATGGASGYYTRDQGGPSLNAASQFSVIFAVAVASSYSLTGSVPGMAELGTGNGTVSLSGPTGTIFQASAQTSPASFSINGVLTAGQYVISAQANTDVNAGNYLSSFTYNIDLELTPVAYQITAIALQSNNVLLTWDAFEGTTNLVQAAGGAANGSYSNNFLTISPPIIIPSNAPGLVVTNYLDVGGATNAPARYYRVVMGTPLLALFTATPTNGALPLFVTFTDASTGTITNWVWGFGDGTTTNLSSPGVTHTYSNSGAYTVSLTVSGPLGSSIDTQSNLITVTQLPGKLQVSPSSLDFGFVVPGTASQQVFVVTNIGGAPIASGRATAGGPFAVASGNTFTLPVGGSSNIVVQFAPSTSGGVTGAVVFSDEFSFAVTNPVTGTGAITNNCIAVGGGDEDGDTWGNVVAGQAYSYQASGIVTYSDGCSADPDGNLTPGGCSPGSIGPFPCSYVIPYSLVGIINHQCTQLGSSGSFVAPLSGTLSAQPDNSSGYYGNSGGYTLCITAITPSAPTAQFTAAPTNGPAPLSVSFMDDSSGTVTNHVWNFGDGFVSTNASSAAVTHIYSNAATYSVTLTVVGPLGSSTNTQPNLILVQ